MYSLYFIYKCIICFKLNYKYLIGCAVTEVPQLEPGGWQNIICRIILAVMAF